ncbi:response regulator [Pararhizobium sp. PWRC1-1]|uniref:response regulator n=1 Tax=Pararhizobium sp. PWRC1-1 TaxID=2804566 RepID=UPI003CED4155
MLDAMCQLLTVLGYTVFAGRSVKDVIEVLRETAGEDKHGIDLIVADYRLGNTTTGLDAVGDLQSYLKHDLPSIILTGDTSPPVLKRISDSGHRLLNKPVNGERLQQAINAILRPASG